MPEFLKKAIVDIVQVCDVKWAYFLEGWRKLYEWDGREIEANALRLDSPRLLLPSRSEKYSYRVTLREERAASGDGMIGLDDFQDADGCVVGSDRKRIAASSV